MASNTGILGLTLITLLFPVRAASASPSNDLDKPYKFFYPQGRQERELEICEEDVPCSLIENPFFYPFIVKRLCRCRNKECPDTFELKRSLVTVFLNNRVQMKFCEDLPKCGRGILRVQTETEIPVHLNCFCPRKRFWRLIPSAETGDGPQAHDPLIKSYVCEKLDRCNETCGSLRPDLYATYQTCTCLTGHLCLHNPEAVLEVTEAGYSGPGYSSACKILPP